MSLTITTRLEEARKGRGEDRITVVETAGRTLILVADGAGGVGGGAAAAEALCAALIHDVTDWAEWLMEQDTRLATRGTGLAAAIVLSVTPEGDIHGASVGDCEAWVFTQAGVLNLTEEQRRKPLIGDGGADPISFTGCAAGGTVVIASDGLWKYMERTRLAALATIRPLESAADALVKGVRLRSGALQDDVAITLIEVPQP